MSYEWVKLFKVKDGHSYFEDTLTGRIAISDDSGTNPENCEDGLLWVDRFKPVEVVETSSGLWLMFIPLMRGTDGQPAKTIEPISGLRQIHDWCRNEIILCDSAKEFIKAGMLVISED